MTNASNDARTSADTAEGGSTRTRRRASGASIKAGADAARTRIASLVWLVAVVCALFLAIGALLIALDANEKNAIVTFVLQGAGLLDGPFNRSNGVFTFAGKDAAVKDALVNWGIAAVVYLMIGKILDRLIRP